jgi:hypothetical protein
MTDGITNNFGMALPVTGTDAGTWGGIVNTNITGFIDSAFGNVFTQPMSSSDVTLTLANWQAGNRIKITGALTGNHILNLPRTDPASADAGAHAVGGNFVVDNETTNTGGPWTITVQTTVGGSTGVQVAQGLRTALYSDGTNVWYADDSRTAKFNTNAGNPNGLVSGNAGAVNAPADVIWDRTNQVLYVSEGSVNWISVGQSLPTPQGYLTPISGIPIITGDALGVNTIFYTPYRGSLIPVFNGSTFNTFSVGEFSIALGGTSGSSIYDLFVGQVSGLGIGVGWGPPWAVVTPGSCARGTGGTSTQLQRINGILTNQFAMSLSNPGGPGSPPYAIAANQGTYIGSVFIDATAGQTTCHRSFGQSRKFGVWNAYNRQPIVLLGGDGTGSWMYGGNTVWRQSNGSGANQILPFMGLAEEAIEVEFVENFTTNSNSGTAQIGIGWNSTTTPSGFSSSFVITGIAMNGRARYLQAPAASSLGVNNSNMIENSGAGVQNATFKGTVSNMLMTVRYQG